MEPLPPKKACLTIRLDSQDEHAKIVALLDKIATRMGQNASRRDALWSLLEQTETGCDPFARNEGLYVCTHCTSIILYVAIHHAL